MKPEGKQALEYLRAKRGLSDRIIEEFQIGYCPASVNHELAGRIVMPLFDPYGEEIIAFTSRDYTAPKRFQHWHEQFDKNRHLYGLNVARQGIVKSDKAVVVEGQFDVACLHTHGFNMTVGLCGTAMSITHIALLSRFCSEVYLLLDPDESGENAIIRARKMYQQYKLASYNLKFFPVELPENLDPDDYLKKFGQQALVKLLRETKEHYSNGRLLRPT